MEAVRAAETCQVLAYLRFLDDKGVIPTTNNNNDTNSVIF